MLIVVRNKPVRRRFRRIHGRGRRPAALFSPHGGGKDVFVHIKLFRRVSTAWPKTPRLPSTSLNTAASKPRKTEVRIEVRTLVAIMIMVLMATSSAFARKASQHHSKPAAPNHHSTTKTDPGGVAREPADVELDRKIGSICRGC